MPPRFLEYLVILCFEGRYSKQNAVSRLKSNILAPQKLWADCVTDLQPNSIVAISGSLSMNSVSRFGRRPCVEQSEISVSLNERWGQKRGTGNRLLLPNTGLNVHWSRSRSWERICSMHSALQAPVHLTDLLVFWLEFQSRLLLKFDNALFFWFNVA